MFSADPALYRALSCELVRAVRGRHSQLAVSRWLGYRTNAVYRWESGRESPGATRFFELARRCHVDCEAAMRRFARGAELAVTELSSRAGLAAFLRQLRGDLPLKELAERSGASRFAVSRWLSGATEPRLSQFLILVEACSLRVIDLVAEFADPRHLPSIAEAHAALSALREAAHNAPWTQAILRCLETAEYQRLERHVPGWLAQRCGISVEEESRCLELLERSGQIEFCDRHFRVGRALSLDTRGSAEATLAQRRFWLQQAEQRVSKQQPGIYAYNVFGVSRKDLVRLQRLHAEYYSQMRTIIAESEPTEVVAVACSQVFALEAEGDRKGHGPVPSRAQRDADVERR